MKARLRESRLLAPCGRWGELTQPSLCLFLHICASLFVEVLRRFQSGALISIEPEIEALKALREEKNSCGPVQKAKLDLSHFGSVNVLWKKVIATLKSERSKHRDCSRQYNRNYQTLKAHFEPWVTKRNPQG